MGPGMLTDKCALSALVGRSPKAAQETTEAPVFSNPEPLPHVKSAPIRELESPWNQMAERLPTPQADNREDVGEIVSVYCSGKSVSFQTQKLQRQVVPAAHLYHLKSCQVTSP